MKLGLAPAIIVIFILSAIFFGQKYIFLLNLFVTLRKNQKR